VDPMSPVLSWAGTTGFESDGVDPNIGVGGETLFRFRVKLTDPDSDEPTYVRLIMKRDNEPYLNRRMWALRGSGPTGGGRVYAQVLHAPLPPGIYTYRFRALDEDGWATGMPTYWQYGPSMLPTLSFTGPPDLEDGVRPNSGPADTTTFLWKVVYQDNDGDPPLFVRVLLWRDGLFYHAFQMVSQAQERPQSYADRYGVVYRCRRTLPVGSYDYVFEAEDKDGRALGPPTVKMSGLTVTAPTPAPGLTSLAAVPTRTGAQITFTLASPAQVQARVLNMAGRPVKTLCIGRDCSAGANTLLWNAQGDTGLSVPNGTYLVEVSTKAADGEQARALGQVVIRR
jgi:hypothetical protein